MLLLGHHLQPWHLHSTKAHLYYTLNALYTFHTYWTSWSHFSWFILSVNYINKVWAAFAQPNFTQRVINLTHKLGSDHSDLMFFVMLCHLFSSQRRRLTCVLRAGDSEPRLPSLCLVSCPPRVQRCSVPLPCMSLCEAPLTQPPVTDACPPNTPSWLLLLKDTSCLACIRDDLFSYTLKALLCIWN